MNFLALPFLFPILTIAAFVLCPIQTSKLLYGCITGFRKDIVSYMTVGERLRAFVCVFAMASEMNVVRRLKQIVDALKVSASWLVVMVIALCFGIPAMAVGAVLGPIGFVVGNLYQCVKVGFEWSSDLVAEALNRAIAPAERSMA